MVRTVQKIVWIRFFDVPVVVQRRPRSRMVQTVTENRSPEQFLDVQVRSCSDVRVPAVMS